VIEKGAKGKFVNSEFLNGLEFGKFAKNNGLFCRKGCGKRLQNPNSAIGAFPPEYRSAYPDDFCQEMQMAAVRKTNYSFVAADVKDWKRREGRATSKIDSCKS
jgi:hypothetical protein